MCRYRQLIPKKGMALDLYPSNFGGLVNLKNLYLNNNNFKIIPTEIKGLKNLKYLDLRNNQILENISNDYKPFGLKINFK